MWSIYNEPSLEDVRPLYANVDTHTGASEAERVGRGGGPGE